MSLEGKVAFVTGASGGIGAAVSRSLVAAGVMVGMASRRGEDLGLGAAAYGLTCDVRNAGQVDAAVAATVERFGRLDIVVANAGVGAYGPFLELNPEHLDEMIDVNLKGTLYAVRAALPHLLESAEGDVVTLASEAGRPISTRKRWVSSSACRRACGARSAHGARSCSCFACFPGANRSRARCGTRSRCPVRRRPHRSPIPCRR